MKNKSIKLFVVIVIALIFASPLTSYAQINEGNVDEKYLKEYFQVGAFSSQVTYDEITSAFKHTVGLNLNYEKEAKGVSGYQAVKLAVDAAEFEELALTYDTQKVNSRLREVYGITDILPAEYSQYVVTALDTKLIDKNDVKGLSNPISGADASKIVLKAITDRGQARNFLGYSNDLDIYNKINNVWEKTSVIKNSKLEAVGNEAVKKGIVTGYNILDKKNNANFLSELTLRYGHSDIKHANQIIGLLNSENIVVKVQLEPKTSAYQYLLEWGVIPEATEKYEVKKEGENFYIAYAAEYDLVLEFNSLVDKEKFDGIILEYAKINKTNAANKPLLYGSWWQPLYTSKVPETDGYESLYNNEIVDGDYRLNSFSLKEKEQSVIDGFKGIDKTADVKQLDIWVDKAFYRYLLGESE